MQHQSASVLSLLLSAIWIVSSCKSLNSDSLSGSTPYSAVTGIPPSTTGVKLDVDAIVKAMNEIKGVEGMVVSKGTVEDCTANTTPHWSHIVSHFYCQLGTARACFTPYVRDSSKPNYQTNQSYRDAYRFCSNDANFTWIARHPIVGPAFQYIMFTVYDPGVDTFTIESQDEAINKFYGVTGASTCSLRYKSSVDNRRPAAERCGNFTTAGAPAPAIGNGGVPLNITRGWIASGSSHNCALTAQGEVKCWGRNSDGQLGDSSTTDRLVPVDVAGLGKGNLAVTAGANHSCALSDSGAVRCWGNDHVGLGGSGLASLVPLDISGLDVAVKDISAGYAHTCALDRNGAVRCWGNNGGGELGNNSFSNSQDPVDVVGLSANVEALVSGHQHSCAVLSNGGVKCWGGNDSGQLGINSAAFSKVPVDVAGLSDKAEAITAGGHHTCVVVRSGKVQCWGENSHGQLGNNTKNSSKVPVTAATGIGVVAVSAGYNHTCALTVKGGVKCWGDNKHGQLGHSSTGGHSTAPVDVTGLGSGVAAVSAGDNHTCAMNTNGSIKCWGRNRNGQLGNDTVVDSIAPVNVGHFP